MKKILGLIFAAGIIMNVSAANISLENSVKLVNSDTLSPKDVSMIDNGIIAEALKSKDYDTISTMAISYYNASTTQSYSGDRKELRKKSIELLIMCHKAKHITSSLFLVTALMPSNPAKAKKIAKEAILFNRNYPKNSLTLVYKNIVMLYVSMVLDNKIIDVKEINFALESMDSLREETPQTKFFSAFLFRKLGSEDMADMYLTEACRVARPRTKIYDYCYNDNVVDVHEPIDDKIVNVNCNKDIGKRCK